MSANDKTNYDTLASENIEKYFTRLSYFALIS